MTTVALTWVALSAGFSPSMFSVFTLVSPATLKVFISSGGGMIFRLGAAGCGLEYRPPVHFTFSLWKSAACKESGFLFVLVLQKRGGIDDHEQGLW